MTSRQQIVQQLREQLGRRVRKAVSGRRSDLAAIEETLTATVRPLQSEENEDPDPGFGSSCVGGISPAVSTGVSELNASLPGTGLIPGTLAEWLTPGPGSGAGTLALLAAREALRTGGALVVCDPRGEFYPASALGWGIPLERLVLLRPRSRADLFWACDQALRCPGVSATLGEFESLNDREFRRLQLSAEAGGGLGLLLRPARARKEPTWADVRWMVEPRAVPLHQSGRPSRAVGGRWIQIELLRCRGGIDGSALVLEIDDVSHVVRVVPTVARAAAAPRRLGSRQVRAG